MTYCILLYSCPESVCVCVCTLFSLINLFIYIIYFCLGWDTNAKKEVFSCCRLEYLLILFINKRRRKIKTTSTANVPIVCIKYKLKKCLLLYFAECETLIAAILEIHECFIENKTVHYSTIHERKYHVRLPRIITFLILIEFEV